MSAGKTILFVAALGVAAVAINHVLKPAGGLLKPSPQALIAAAVAQVNATAPTMVNDTLRIDGSSAGDNLFKMNYTLTRSSLPDDARPKLEAIVRPKLIEMYCKDSRSQPLMENGISTEIVLRDPEKIDLVDITLSAADCKPGKS